MPAGLGALDPEVRQPARSVRFGALPIVAGPDRAGDGRSRTANPPIRSARWFGSFSPHPSTLTESTTSNPDPWERHIAKVVPVSNENMQHSRDRKYSRARSNLHGDRHRERLCQSIRKYERGTAEFGGSMDMAGTICVGRLSRHDARPGLIQAARALLGGLIVLAVPIALLAIPHSDTVVVIGSPQSDTPDLARIVAVAGGSVLSLGGRPFIVVARADTDGFVRRLYGAGARLVVDGRLARFCGRTAPRADLTSRPVPGPGTPDS